MEEKKGFSINWVETGKLFLAALVIFTLKHFVVNFAGVEFRNNETTSMGGVLLGLVFVAMVLEYWKGFNIIGKGDGKGLEKDCSVVTATYNVDNNTLGKISFIGPTRMDYARVCSIINYMSILLNKKK